MKLTILAYGSRGDVQPYVALGKGFAQAGYDVCIATESSFADFVRENGLDFFPVTGDVRDLLQGDFASQAMEQGFNLLKLGRQLRETVRPFYKQLVADWAASVQGADCFIAGGILTVYAGISISQATRLPFLESYLQPLHPTTAFPSSVLPLPKMPAFLHKFSHKLPLYLAYPFLRGIVNQARHDVLGLPPLSRRLQYQQPRPMLHGFSPTVIPQPPDWIDSMTPVGYWFLDTPSNYQPPQKLTDFLANGEPPVYVGFGSMNTQNPAAVAKIVVEALQKAGRRGIVLTGWGGMAKMDLPNTILQIDGAPHDWLFPKMAAVVHHGGAGTTAAGLRAGVPNVIVPFVADQPFWAKRVQQLGVSPAPLPRQKLTVDGLAERISSAVNNPTISQKARAVGQAIQAENGISNAVSHFEKYAKPYHQWDTNA